MRILSLFAFFALLGAGLSVSAQTSENETETADGTFEIVEVSAEPIGGFKAFYQAIADSIQYPQKARRMNVQGKVFVQFIVEKDGSLTNLKIAQGIGAGCDAEAIRAIKSVPIKWKPGMQYGKPVRQRMVLPVAFSLRGGSHSRKCPARDPWADPRLSTASSNETWNTPRKRAERK